MEVRKARLFGYTTEENFEKLVNIMKEDKISQSALLHVLVDEMIAKWEKGKLSGRKVSGPGAPRKVKNIKYQTPFPKKKARY